MLQARQNCSTRLQKTVSVDNPLRPEGRDRMRQILIFLFVALLVLSCERKPLPSPEKAETPSVPKVVLEKEKVERKEPLPPDVKIKFKRDGKDNYSWELNSSDADQILKVNEKLRKGVGGEPSR